MRVYLNCKYLTVLVFNNTLSYPQPSKKSKRFLKIVHAVAENTVSLNVRLASICSALLPRRHGATARAPPTASSRSRKRRTAAHAKKIWDVK